MGTRAGVTGLLVLAAVSGLVVSGHAEQASAQGETSQPNVVVLMTDDQTAESMRVMPKTASLLGDEGVEFTNSVVSNPNCCPSRSTYLTGQYSHNNGVLRNAPPLGGYGALDESETLPVWLQRAGYYTAHIGKYLNGYVASSPIPPGWDEWRGSIDRSTYSMYGYTLNENGVLTTYGNPDNENPGYYQTDVYAQKAVDVIANRAPLQQPFFLSLAPLAPHGEVDLGEPDNWQTPGPRAAPRDEGVFAGRAQPRGPSYNEADVSDKPSEVRARPPVAPYQMHHHQLIYNDRLESLLAVDDMVESIVEALRAAGELDETLIVFTSDNGLILGEHRVLVRKELPYEESIRVPLMMRGPGIPAGEEREQPVANVDLAPTILDFAQASPGLSPDGRSLRALASDDRLEPGRGLVIENWCEQHQPCFDPTIPRYQGVRTPRYLYAEYPNGDRELYDLDSDPYQLQSRHSDPGYADVRGALARLLDRLRSCGGDECRAEPRLELRVDHATGPGGCVDGPVRLRLEGADTGEAIGMDVYAGADAVAADNTPPFDVTVPIDRLEPLGTALRANATVLDSRALSLDATLPALCSAQADLRVDASDSADPVPPGSRFNYTIAVTNSGPASTSDVTVENVLPGEVELVAASVPGTGGEPCNTIAGNRIECALGTLPAGAGAEVSIGVQARELGVAVNAVSVSGAAPDPVETNDSDTEQTSIEADAPPTCRSRSASIVGTSAADTLSGTSGDDVITGLGGDDYIAGFGGEDVICGGDHNDRLAGFSGADWIASGPGNDQLRGAQGDDDLAGMAGRDDLGGGDGDDLLDGGPDADRCLDGSGNNLRRGCESTAARTERWSAAALIF